MKKLYIFCTFIFIVGHTSAQNTSGIIVYEEKFKLNIQIDDNSPEAQLIPKEQTARKTLYFTLDESLYKAEAADASPTEIEQETDQGMVKIKMDRSDEKSYCDLKDQLVIEQRDLMTRKFLVTSDLKNSDWKMTGNQKMIAGYPCLEATRMEPDRAITAWFTAAIPVSSGPGRFAGLPGMVLAVDINNGQVAITATSVEFKEIEKDIIIKPVEGKKVTWEEFDKIRKEKQKEMQEQNGGDGNVMIKIRK